ncbi:MAG: hypothetical protein Q4A60_02800 [Pasteurellaceae bacterium]|nr:hypothetical protein [Pasteurellaceae bacterium]
MMNSKTFWENWIGGWVISRQIPQPTAVENGYCFALNDGRRQFEWLMFSPENLGEILPRVSNKDYLCVSGLKAVPQGWKQTMTADMMVCEQLSQQEVTLPEKFTLKWEESDNREVLSLFSPNDELVCEGQAGFYHGFIVPDRIGTEPNFRRQGFGTLVMALLNKKAAERGIHQGLLCASEMGKQLYLTLGWHSIGQYVRIVREDYTRD